MGERGQIKIDKVYLYTHWRGFALKEILAEALSKKWRWSDKEYLTRIIFDVMTKNERDTETGYGIGTNMHFDLGYPLLVVDVDNKIVQEGNQKWSFEDFIKQKWDGEEM